MKLNLEEIKKKFDDRCNHLKIQLIKYQRDHKKNESKTDRQASNTDRQMSEMSAKYLKDQRESNRDHSEK